ncbi:hypothetical protein BT93_C1903 [Corymbia citriodora subsp. variegata]|nr:hypothetical protein BT93_C1903 [Corymbia citriodora subsp. variegata]
MVLRLASSYMSIPQTPRTSTSLSQRVPLRKPGKMWKRGCTRRLDILPSLNGDGPGLRVFVLSDLHTDYSENMMWVECLSTAKHKRDVLLVAGDVAETYNNFVLTMSLLKERFKHVFYVPGNHDLWCRRESDVSACKDYHACKWPEELSNRDTSLASYFDAMNENNMDLIEDIKKTCEQIITFSHFVPRQELCPEKRMLFYPNLPKIIGSDSLEVRLRSIHGAEGSGSACHVFGHTHFCWDAVLDGIRYVQAPLAYPRERKRRMNGGENWLPFCIYSDGEFAERLSPCYWSDYYSVNPRQPRNTELAPWVARFYSQRKDHNT